MDLVRAAGILAAFQGTSLTQTLSSIEDELRQRDSRDCSKILLSRGSPNELLRAAGLIKYTAGQINVTIHALGILSCLPHLLETGEVVEYASLGAGNTGRKFDLETNRRVAEFKFINWRGGPESIRQNSIFKDFYLLAQEATEKRKYLYVIGADHVLKFLNGGRALSSVLSRNNKLERTFAEKFNTRYVRVKDYYGDHRHKVTIEDVTQYVPQLTELAARLSETSETE